MTFENVLRSSEADIEASRRSGESNVQKMNDEDPHYQGVVRMRGLPYSVTSAGSRLTPYTKVG